MSDLSKLKNNRLVLRNNNPYMALSQRQKNDEMSVILQEWLNGKYKKQKKG
jgi:hypothetical protein